MALHTSVVIFQKISGSSNYPPSPFMPMHNNQSWFTTSKLLTKWKWMKNSFTVWS